jgi:hypothetical protein
MSLQLTGWYDCFFVNAWFSGLWWSCYFVFIVVTMLGSFGGFGQIMHFDSLALLLSVFAYVSLFLHPPPPPDVHLLSRARCLCMYFIPCRLPNLPPCMTRGAHLSHDGAIDVTSLGRFRCCRNY